MLEHNRFSNKQINGEWMNGRNINEQVSTSVFCLMGLGKYSKMLKIFFCNLAIFCLFKITSEL